MRSVRVKRRRWVIPLVIKLVRKLRSEQTSFQLSYSNKMNRKKKLVKGEGKREGERKREESVHTQGGRGWLMLSLQTCQGKLLSEFPSNSSLRH